MNEILDPANETKLARIAVRVTLAGFALMTIAAALMWVQFGPNMFIDLATAVINCF